MPGRQGRIATIAAAALTLTAAQPGAQTRPNALTWGFLNEVETLDPYGTAKRSSQLVIRNVLKHLAVRDPVSGEAKPALATAWKWINDTTIEFTLRRGVKFHDGQAFDAGDVVYTVEYIKKPGVQISFARADYEFLKGAEKVDDHTVRLLLAAPTPSAIDRLTQTLFILPREAHAKLGARDFGTRPVGTGPYRVAAFEAGRRVELVRNDAYYAADWGRPRLDKIVVVTIPDVQTQVAEVTRGRVDFLWTLQADQVEQLKPAKDVTVVTGGSVAVRFLSLDSFGRSGANPMQDKHVRMAIAHAINREAIAKVLRGPASMVIHAPCHPKQLGCLQDVTKYEFDVGKAKALMRASGHPNGFETAIAAFTENGPVAEAIIGDLREIGIKAKLDFRVTSAWIKVVFGGRMQATVVPWPSNGIYDVSALVPLFFMGDQGDYTRDSEVIGWFKQAGSIIDRRERERLYALGFAKIAREAYVVPLMTDVTNYAYRGNLDFTPPVDGYPLMYMTGWK